MLEKYLHSLEVSDKSDRTIATRKGQLSSFLARLLQAINSNDPLEITSIDAAKYRKHLQARGLEPNTVNTALSSIMLYVLGWLRKATWPITQSLKLNVLVSLQLRHVG